MMIEKSEPEASVPGSVPSSDRELGTRIELVADLYETRKSAAEAAGVSVDALQRYIRGANRPTIDAMRGLCGPQGVSLDWLASGTGLPRPVEGAGPGLARKMKTLGIVARDGGAATPGDYGSAVSVSGASPGDATRVATSGEPASTTDVVNVPLPAGFALVPRLSLKSASVRGSLDDAADFVEHWAYNIAWLEHDLKVFPDRLCVLEHVGNSMEPDIVEGESLLVDRSVDRYIGDGVYLVSFERSLMIKQLQRVAGGTLRLVSRNPHYESQTVNDRDDLLGVDFKVLGRVVGKPSFTKL